MESHQAQLHETINSYQLAVLNHQPDPVFVWNRSLDTLLAFIDHWRSSFIDTGSGLVHACIARDPNLHEEEIRGFYTTLAEHHLHQVSGRIIFSQQERCGYEVLNRYEIYQASDPKDPAGIAQSMKDWIGAVLYWTPSASKTLQYIVEGGNLIVSATRNNVCRTLITPLDNPDVFQNLEKTLIMARTQQRKDYQRNNPHITGDTLQVILPHFFLQNNGPVIDWYKDLTEDLLEGNDDISEIGGPEKP